MTTNGIPVPVPAGRRSTPRFRNVDLEAVEAASRARLKQRTGSASGKLMDYFDNSGAGRVGNWLSGAAGVVEDFGAGITPGDSPGFVSDPSRRAGFAPNPGVAYTRGQLERGVTVPVPEARPQAARRRAAGLQGQTRQVEQIDPLVQTQRLLAGLGYSNAMPTVDRSSVERFARLIAQARGAQAGELAGVQAQGRQAQRDTRGWYNDADRIVKDAGANQLRTADRLASNYARAARGGADMGDSPASRVLGQQAAISGAALRDTGAAQAGYFDRARATNAQQMTGARENVSNHFSDLERQLRSQQTKDMLGYELQRQQLEQSAIDRAMQQRQQRNSGAMEMLNIASQLTPRPEQQEPLTPNDMLDLQRLQLEIEGQRAEQVGDDLGQIKGWYDAMAAGLDPAVANQLLAPSTSQGAQAARLLQQQLRTRRGQAALQAYAAAMNGQDE